MMTYDPLSADERQKARELLEVESELWDRLAEMRHTTSAEREIFRRNAAILERVAALVAD